MRLLILLGMALLLAAMSAADGSVFCKSVAVPDMPYQRALVCFRDRTETLIIEPTINGPNEPVAWVVPVPKPPDRFLEVERGFFTRTAFRARPHLGGYDELPWTLTLVFCLLTSATLGLLAAKKKSVWGWLLLGLLLLVLAVILFPVFAQSKAGAGVDVLRAHPVGDYDVQVVRGDTGDALREWLAKNDIPLPAQATPIVDDYVRRGWVFVVSKFRGAVSGAVQPTPLAMEFKTQAPIYPMRLTSTLPKQLTLDLYVLAAGTARCAPLLVWVSKPCSGSWSKPEGITNINELRFAGAQLTRMRGVLGPADMARDYAIELQPSRLFWQKLWTTEGILNSVLNRLIAGSLVGFWLGPLFAWGAGSRKRLLKVLVACLAPLAWIGYFLSTEWPFHMMR